jgi:hypothetical protein
MKALTVAQVEEQIDFLLAEQARHNRRALALFGVGRDEAAMVSVRDAEYAIKQRQWMEEKLEALTA